MASTSCGARPPRLTASRSRWSSSAVRLRAPTAPHPPHQVEEYEVLDGRCEVVLDGEWRTLAPGESATVPLEAVRTFRNHSGGVVRVRNWQRPAMRFEDLIERTCHTLQAAGVKRSATRGSFSTSRGACWNSTTRSSPGEGVSAFRCRLWRASHNCFPRRLADLHGSSWHSDCRAFTRGAHCAVMAM
jgi:mannose-6-phosphate isomerase-like protein (cupin superfamily)